MSCETTRRQILAAERPERPPAALRSHLAGCAACRDWLHHLIEVEARIPLLPVPPSDDAKDRLLKQLREAPLVPESLRVVVPELPFMPPKERGLRKLAVALALAAAVVMFAIGLSIWPRHPPVADAVQTQVASGWTSADAKVWLAELRQQRLAQAPPGVRVEILAEFADKLLRKITESEKLPAADKLESLAKAYEETVQQELMTQARAITPDQKRKLLPLLANEFGRTESEFERLASAAPDASAGHLRHIAAVARDASREMVQLARAAV